MSKYDNNETTLFYTGITGALILTSIGPFFYTEVKITDWLWILLISILGLIAHLCIINALKISEASLLQPFNYLHLVFVSIIGIFIFPESSQNEAKCIFKLSELNKMIIEVL